MPHANLEKCTSMPLNRVFPFFKIYFAVKSPLLRPRARLVFITGIFYFGLAFLALLGGAGMAAASGENADGSSPIDQKGSWAGDFFTVNENAWSLNAEYFTTSENSRNNIDAGILEIIRSWRFKHRLELQGRGGVFQSSGSRSQTAVVNNGLASGDSTVTAIIGGGAVRFYLLDLGPTHLFAEGIAQILYAPNQEFPAGGTGLNGFLRGGGGLSCDLSKQYTIEAVFHVANVSNGSGNVPQNPVWNGQGGGLSIRRRF